MITWSISGGWGNGCPNQNNFFIAHKEAVGGVCTGPEPWQVSRRPPNVSDHPINDLPWDSEVCIRVYRNNRSRDSVSATVKVSTPGLPTVSNAGFDVASINKCVGSPYTGRLNGTANDANINNPITYQFDIQPNGGTIEEMKIALVADSFVASLPNADKPVDGSNEYLYIDHMLPRLHDTATLNKTGFTVRDLAGTPTFYGTNSNSSPYYGAGATSGDITVGSGVATLRGIGTDTTLTSLGGGAYRARFTIEVNPTFSSESIGIYIAGIELKSNGARLTQSPQPGTSTFYDDNLIYQRVDDWNIDMIPPTVSIGDPVFLSGNNFQVAWNVNDNSTLTDIRSYCYLVDPGLAEYVDTTAGANITFDEIIKQYPDPDQCLMTSQGPNTRTYNYITGAITSDTIWGAHATDPACNVTEYTKSNFVPTAWFNVIGGNIYAGGGVTGVRLPNSNANLADIGVNLTGNSFLSTYLAISGGPQIPAGRQSKFDTYDTNYQSGDVLPTDFGEPDWYSIIERKLVGTGSLNVTGATTLSGNLASSYGQAIGSTYYIRHTGNLAVSSGSVCNLNSVILVEGNLTIDPDFTRTANGSCIFVANGNINITAGTYKSGGVGPNGTALHDRVEAMLVANGTFTSENDPQAAPAVPDALYISGSVYATNIALNRTLPLSQLAAQPAEIIEFDPIYLMRFGDLLSASEFSLREY